MSIRSRISKITKGSLERKSPRGLFAALTLSVGLLGVPGSAIAITTETFTGTVVSGTFAGTVGTGSVTFDEGLVTGTGSEFLTPIDGLELEFTIFGQVFTQDDDASFPAFPQLSFFDGVIEFLNFTVSELAFDVDDVVTAIDLPGVLEFSIFDIDNSTGPGFIAEVFVTESSFLSVPEPGAAALFGVGLIGVAGLRMKKKNPKGAILTRG